MLKYRDKRRALGTATDVNVDDVCVTSLSSNRRQRCRRLLEVFESKKVTAESHEQNEGWPEHHLRTRSLFLFLTNNMI